MPRRLAVASIALVLGCGGGEPAPSPVIAPAPAAIDPARLAGGETTVDDATPSAFSLAARNLDADRRASFMVGNNLFADNWVTAPSSTSARDGLGPLFDATSCSGCHLHDGRGRVEDDGSVVSAVVRLSSAGGGPDPIYGIQLQRRAILGVSPDGDVRVVPWPRREGEDDDLVRARPVLSLEHGIAEGQRVSLRVAPHLVGLGLLEAIEASVILARADPDDADHDGISGRAHHVTSRRSGASMLGRFGWKASQPTVEEQVCAALAGDMGITSSLVPTTECLTGYEACSSAPNGGEPEISDALLAHLVLYARTLAVPAARGIDEPAVVRGRALFDEVGCPACHVPSVTTGESDVPALAHQAIRPYTDLLLHDMGEGLADDFIDGEASGSEWRTPPLWGIGLIETVNGHTRLMHDGRANGIDEAIRWHGGEASAARDRYLALPADARAALVRFVGSI